MSDSGEKSYDVIIVGAGPAGLGAAIESGKAGARTLLLDENQKPGGQLFKQIHKFFGSKEHFAGMRGFLIGEKLLEEAVKHNVEFRLGARVWGLYPDGCVTATDEENSLNFKGKKIILATGASENALSFPGCTLPGVITAGAAQTFVNVQHVLPGKDFVVVGSGNVGLIVTYQLLQAGANVIKIIEAAPKISGYGVHAAKIRRAGIQILTGHTIISASGRDQVERVIIAKVDENFNPIEGTQQTILCDTVALAVGLSPRIELAGAGGCEMTYSKTLGGVLPVHDDNMETSFEHILIAGDLSGIEEASTALDEGRLAGCRAAYRLGLMTLEDYTSKKVMILNRLAELRCGPFGNKRMLAKEEIWKKAV
ncbi:MAG: NAD(P)/FAD-dependent oxidoreductase [Lachnospiraceae bacterium]|nr:NAD(P)/FAD-dependent oxidoreductase [Lachnospiraceae bacterium]